MKNIIYTLLFCLPALIYSQSPLCPSTATSFCCEYVSSVTIDGTTFNGNTDFNGPGYYDYTSQPIPDFQAGTVVPISVVATTNGAYQQYVKLWIDFNGNGDLEDAGELVFDETQLINNTTYTFTGNINVPITAFNGPKYLRLIMVYSSSPTLCGNYGYGNTFDFQTEITGGVPAETLTVTTTGTGNVISTPTGINTAIGANSALFPQNSSISLTATPQAPQSFIGWTGDVTSMANPLTVNLDTSKNIVANFAQQGPPIIDNFNFSNLTYDNVDVSADVTSANGGTITDRGFINAYLFNLF